MTEQSYAIWSQEKQRLHWDGICAKNFSELLSLEESRGSLSSIVQTSNIDTLIQGIYNETDVSLTHSKPLVVVVFFGDYHSIEEAAKDGALHVSSVVEIDMVDAVINGAKAAASVYSSNIDWKVLPLHEARKLGAYGI